MRKRINRTYRKTKPKLHWFINNEGVSLTLSLFVFLMAILLFIEKAPKDMKFIDYTVFLTVITAVCLNFISIFLGKYLANHFEDDLKLTIDYDELTKKYNENFIEIKNNLEDDVAQRNLLRLSRTKNMPVRSLHSLKVPVLKVTDLYNKEIAIYDEPTKMYELPEKIEQEFEELFKAHAASKIYNQLNIRISDWYTKDGVFVMESSRTTYFDSLVTNRAMDFKWRAGVSNRDLYGYGPFIPELKESELSNHIGFNGLIESKDGYIPFIRRNKKVSIAKGLYSTSVAASLKIKYAVNEEKRFTLAGLEKAIIREIEDELKISEDKLEEFSLKNSVIAAYQDLLEGGKPQLLIYVKSKLDKKEIIEKFMLEKRAKRKRLGRKNIEDQVLEDGTSFIWIHKSELSSLVFSAEYMVYQGKVLNMVPSSIASVYLCREHLEKIERL